MGSKYQIVAMSYRQIFYQIVFSTKGRLPTIPEAHCRDLYRYITAIVHERNCFMYQINGIEDHIHIFCDLHPTIALANFVKEIKVATSQWMKGSIRFPEFTGWQDRYGAFTYNIRERDKIIRYVANQKEHHRDEGSLDEFKRLLIENDIPFDEKYLE